LALVAVVVLSIVNANEKNRLSRSISAANVAAGGEVATCGKRVYLIDDDAVYLTDGAYKKREKLFAVEKGWIDCICADEKAVYAVTAFYDGGYNYQLNRYTLADKTYQKLSDLDGNSSYLSVCGDYLYFLQAGTVKAYCLSTGKMMDVVEDVQAFTVTDEGLYFIRKGMDNILEHKATPAAEETTIGALPYDLFQQIQTFYFWDGKIYAVYAYVGDGNTYLDCSGYEIELGAEEAEYSRMEGARMLIPGKNGAYFLIRIDTSNNSEVYDFIEHYYEIEAQEFVDRFPNVYYSIYDSDVEEYANASLHLSSYVYGRLYFGEKNDTSISSVRTERRYYSDMYRTPDGILLWNGIEEAWDFVKN